MENLSQNVFVFSNTVRKLCFILKNLCNVLNVKFRVGNKRSFRRNSMYLAQKVDTYSSQQLNCDAVELMTDLG
jgi:hypothetical protein